LGTPLDVADAKCTLACVLTRIGVFDEAGSYLDEAMAAYQEAGWRRGQAAGLLLRGQGWMGLGRREKAAACFAQALAQGQATHSIEAIVGAQVGLGRVALASQQWARAERWCVEARARARRARLSTARIEAQTGLARVYLAQERWEPARIQAEQAWTLSRESGFRDLALDSVDVLGQVWRGLGRTDRAHACFEDARALEEQLAATLPPAYSSLFMRRGDEVERI
jgi:tetratricopeptide (TPR) repeat protein